GPPLVLLDASLSMVGQGGPWGAALDTARALARGGGGGVIWRFGRAVRAFDTLPPADGATRLGPALAAAAARGGPVIVVTDGAITDLPDVPPDLVRRARLVVLPRPPFFDAFVASIEGPRRVAAGDTIRLRVGYGTAGKRPGITAGKRPGKGGEGREHAGLTVSLAGRRLASSKVTLTGGRVVAAADPAQRPTPGSPRGAPSLLWWPTVGGVPGDWYVEPPPPSPVAAALAGILWDSVPPAAAATDVAPGRDTSRVVALNARLARRGVPRPILQLAVRDGVRQATLSATGLYRWVFRGGASAQAYRALVDALADWLLDGEGGRGKGERAVPESQVVANGLPL